MTILRVGIVGSRKFPDLKRVEAWVEALAQKYPTCLVISGGARGVDVTAEITARGCGLDVLSYRPVEVSPGKFEIAVFATGSAAQDWHEQERQYSPQLKSYVRACFCRNGWIAADCEKLVAFTTGSNGTADTIGKARKLGREVWVYE